MSTTKFYAIQFCGDEAEGPYDSAEQIMTERELVENYDAWPIAIFKVTLPDSVAAQVDGYMTMRDDSELQPALTPGKRTIRATCHIESIIGSLLAEAGDVLTVEAEDDGGSLMVHNTTRDTYFIIEQGEYEA